MNTQLKDAIREIELLPEADQQEVAEGLAAYLRLVKSAAPLLTADQQAGVRAALAEARSGDLACDEEMAEVWRSFEE